VRIEVDLSSALGMFDAFDHKKAYLNN
jgi:hypothetical protein